MGVQFLNTVLASVVAGFVTLVGVYLVFLKKEWAERRSVFFLSFSGGMVLTVAFTHLLPESLEINANAPVVVLLTLIIYYILEHAIAIHTCREGECDVHRIGMPALIGIGLHSFVDGILIGVGFEIDLTMGITASLAIFSHQLPVGITVASLLVHEGFSKSKIIFTGWAMAFAIIAGAMGAYLFIEELAPVAVGAILAFGAGIFIYIGASDLLPETHKKRDISNIFLVLAGVILVYIITYLTGGG